MKFLRLRKSAEEINFEKDLMEAGKSKGKKYKISEEQLEMGKEVEKEHTTNPEIAAEWHFEKTKNYCQPWCLQDLIKKHGGFVKKATNGKPQLIVVVTEMDVHIARVFWVGKKEWQI